MSQQDSDPSASRCAIYRHLQEYGILHAITPLEKDALIMICSVSGKIGEGFA